jgi:hypothetical protein
VLRCAFSPAQVHSICSTHHSRKGTFASTLVVLASLRSEQKPGPSTYRDALLLSRQDTHQLIDILALAVLYRILIAATNAPASNLEETTILLCDNLRRACTITVDIFSFVVELPSPIFMQLTPLVLAVMLIFLCCAVNELGACRHHHSCAPSSCAFGPYTASSLLTSSPACMERTCCPPPPPLVCVLALHCLFSHWRTFRLLCSLFVHPA